MDPAALLDASRRELDGWQALAAAYRVLDALLDDAAVDVDAAAIAAARARADDAIVALRAAHEVLGPVRLAGVPIVPDVATLWREAAAVAAEAAATNARLVVRARRRQAAVGERLGILAHGRRGLQGYRPGAAPRAATSHHV